MEVTFESRQWIRGEDARHLAWGDAPTETLCCRKLGDQVRRYSMSEANCEDCRNAFFLTNLSMIGRAAVEEPK